MHRIPHGRASFTVKANQELPSGTRLSINVHDHRHETSSETFSLQDSDSILEDLLEGGTAYLEWLSPGDQRVIFRHILLLDGFHERLDECEGTEPSKEASHTLGKRGVRQFFLSFGREATESIRATPLPYSAAFGS